MRYSKTIRHFKMTRYSMAFLMGLFVAGMLQATNVVIQNQNQFDNWQSDANHVIQDAAKKNGIKPGERFSMSLQVCIDNEVANIIFFVTGGQGGTVYVDKVENTPTGEECNPSTDLSGGNLSSPNSIQAINNTVGGILGTKWKGPASLSKSTVTPRATPSTSFALVPPYRDVPFIPVYSPSIDFPTSLDCNPQNNATTIQVHHASNTVTVNNGCSGAVIATIPVGSAPLQVQVSPDASTAVVTCFSNEIDLIDLTTNTRAASIPTTGDINPSGVAISPDGSTAYVTSFTNHYFGGTAAVLVVNIAQRTIVKTIPVSDLPQSVFVTPDGSQVWVTHPFVQFSPVLEVIDTLTNTTSARLSLQGSYSIAFNSTGTRAFVTSGTSNVAVIDTSSFATLATITVGQGPVDIALTPEDGLLIVNNYQDQSISLVDATGLNVVGTFPLPGPARGLAFVQ
jgi:YVTN family beta-propeller protein